jgi:hypothetical protein
MANVKALKAAMADDLEELADRLFHSARQFLRDRIATIYLSKSASSVHGLQHSRPRTK